MLKRKNSAVVFIAGMPTILICLICASGIFSLAVAAKEESAFGLDCALTVITTVNSELEHHREYGINGVDMGWFEPEPPQNGQHSYDWSILYERFKGVKCEGCVYHIDTRIAPWALIKDESVTTYEPGYGKPHAAYVRINPRYRQAWKDFVIALLHEFPRKPVKSILLNSEVENEWVDVEGYLEAIKLTWEAVQEVDPEIKILVGGFNMGDFFSLSEEAQQALLKQRSRLGASMRRKLNFLTTFMAKAANYTQYFDVVSLHLNHHYQSIPDTVAWFKRKMDEHGYEKPFWSDDAANGTIDIEAIFPGILDRLFNGDRAAIEQYNAWQAPFVLKKNITAVTAGVKKIIVQNTVDAEGSYHMNQWGFMGLVSRQGVKKPSFYTYKMMLNKLKGFRDAEKINDYTYKFSFADKRLVFVLWSDEGPTSIDFSNYVSTNKVKISHIVTALDGNGNPVYVPDKVISAKLIAISEIPVFVEGVKNE